MNTLKIQVVKRNGEGKKEFVCKHADCAKAAEKILNAFVWRDSPDGQDYWADVHEKLHDYVMRYSDEKP